MICKTSGKNGVEIQRICPEDVVGSAKYNSAQNAAQPVPFECQPDLSKCIHAKIQSECAKVVSVLKAHVDKRNNSTVLPDISFLGNEAMQEHLKRTSQCVAWESLQKSSIQALTLLKTQTIIHQKCMRESARLQRSIEMPTITKKKSFCEEDVFFRYEHTEREMRIRPGHPISFTAQAGIIQGDTDISMVNTRHMHQATLSCNGANTESMQDVSYETSAFEEARGHENIMDFFSGVVHSDTHTFTPGKCKKKSVQCTRIREPAKAESGVCLQTPCSTVAFAVHSHAEISLSPGEKKGELWRRRTVQHKDCMKIGEYGRLAWNNISAFLRKHTCYHGTDTL